MLRHRSTVRTQPPSNGLSYYTHSAFGGASCTAPSPGSSRPNYQLTQVSSIVDEVKVRDKNKACDSYRKDYTLSSPVCQYRTSSQPADSAWTSYCTWTGEFVHWKRWWDSILPNGATYGGSIFGPVSEPFTGLHRLAELNPEGTMKIVVPSNLDDLVSRSLNAMLPAIKSELSVPNALIELKDFRRIRHSFTKCNDVIKKVLAQVSTNKSFQRGRTLRSLVKASSDIWLQKSFNVEPLISDIQKFRNVLKSVADKISKLIAEEGSILTKHHQVRLTGYLTVNDYTGEDWFADNGVKFNIRRKSYYINPRFNATVVYSYKITQYEREHAHILGMLDGLGVNWRPSIIWNAIPFSFVVDWFLGVSRWLDNFQLRNIEPINEINSFVWSVTYDRVTEFDIKFNLSPQPSVSSNRIPMFAIRERFYKRVPLDRVSTYDSIKSSGLSLKELSLSLALKFS